MRPTGPDTPPPAQDAASATPLIDHVANWLMTQALANSDVESLFQGCCERLLAAGIPLWRGHITFPVLHPQYAATGLTWTRRDGIRSENYAHSVDGKLSESFKASPFYYLMGTRVPYLRRRLVGDEAVLDFPVLPEFRDAGATDYLAFIIPFGQGERDGVIGSWSCDRASGFSEQDIQALMRIQKRLGVACKMRIKEQIARNVVDTYLGSLAGRRVLEGQIKRGDGETIRSVIWYSDLRGSTRMADTLPRDDFIQALNDYFACAGGAVLAHGGEILSFIGDAVLAIFPLECADATNDDAGAAAACARALDACRDAQHRLAEANAQRAEAGRDALSFGLALHLGDVVFGNIGVPERVSFSVIGPTVNEVARLEALTKELNRTVLASAEFAKHTDIAWENLGAFALRGVTEPVEVCSPA